MTCSNSAANVLGLSKQDNTSGTCAAESQQHMHWDHANETAPMVYADDTG